MKGPCWVAEAVQLIGLAVWLFGCLAVIVDQGFDSLARIIHLK